MSKKIRVFEAFAGYGSQSMALRNLGVNYEVVAISEIDKYAIQAYEAIHGKVNNLGDISKINVDDIPDHDLFTYSFPCQDISVAGKMEGIEKGQTRSGLLYECERIIEGKKPKYLLLENVKNLVGKKFKPQFDEWLKYLEELGYTNYWKVLNAKDYGIPQNRERVFVVSILGTHEPFRFEEGKDLSLRLKDILEKNVDEKYYINTDRAKQLIEILKKKGDLKADIVPCDSSIYKPKALEVANCITARYDAGIQNKQSIGVAIVERMGGLFDTEKTRRQAGAVWNKEGLAPTLDTMQGGYRQPLIAEGKFICEQRTDEGLRFFKDNICGTIRTINSGGDKRVIELNEYEFRIRKLTPRECFRLMGVGESNIDKIQAAGISNTQQYKLAGNSIVVPVLEGIFRNLFIK